MKNLVSRVSNGRYRNNCRSTRASVRSDNGDGAVCSSQKFDCFVPATVALVSLRRWPNRPPLPSRSQQLFMTWLVLWLRETAALGAGFLEWGLMWRFMSALCSAWVARARVNIAPLVSRQLCCWIEYITSFAFADTEIRRAAGCLTNSLDVCVDTYTLTVCYLYYVLERMRHVSHLQAILWTLSELRLFCCFDIATWAVHAQALKPFVCLVDFYAPPSV